MYFNIFECTRSKNKGKTLYYLIISFKIIYYASQVEKNAIERERILTHSDAPFRMDREGARIPVHCIHAISGCDTTSCFYFKGKNSIFKSFEKASSEVKNAVEIFKQKNQSVESISENGISCILQMYNAGKKIKCLNELRHVIFLKNIVKEKAVNLASLPPTNDAAAQHCFRVYLQVQKWLSNDLLPEQWGWKKGKILTPNMMTKPPAPSEILKIIFCNCKKGCGNACSCRKAGLFCTEACGACKNDTCTNIPPVESEEIDYDEEIISNEN